MVRRNQILGTAMGSPIQFFECLQCQNYQRMPSEHTSNLKILRLGKTCRRSCLVYFFINENMN